MVNKARWEQIIANVRAFVEELRRLAKLQREEFLSDRDSVAV
jgi:hypothetical protein